LLAFLGGLKTTVVSCVECSSIFVRRVVPFQEATKLRMLK
jgi:hypothetical protein